MIEDTDARLGVGLRVGDLIQGINNGFFCKMKTNPRIMKRTNSVVAEVEILRVPVDRMPSPFSEGDILRGFVLVDGEHVKQFNYCQHNEKELRRSYAEGDKE